MAAPLCTLVSVGSVDAQRACPLLPVTCLSDGLVLSGSALGAIPAGLSSLDSSGCRAPWNPCPDLLLDTMACDLISNDIWGLSLSPKYTWAPSHKGLHLRLVSSSVQFTFNLTLCDTGNTPQHPVPWWLRQ